MVVAELAGELLGLPLQVVVSSEGDCEFWADELLVCLAFVL